MAIEFKAVKYKHQLAARELGEVYTKAQWIEFVMPLVKAWDYKDDDTGEPIPPGQPEELTIEQLDEVLAEADLMLQRSFANGVKKTSEST